MPWPCISRLATKAFQCVTEPQPVQVCRLTPARPNAGGISVAAGLAVGPERLAVEEQLGVEFARTPALSTVRTVASSTPSSVGERAAGSAPAR